MAKHKGAFFTGNLKISSKRALKRALCAPESYLCQSIIKEISRAASSYL